MSTITESEKKRLQSLQGEETGVQSERAISTASIKKLDIYTTKHKKIISNDDVDEKQSPKSKKRKRDLLDSDNDDEKDSLWNKDEFSIKENKPKKTIFGNDARFTLDDCFVKNNDQTEKMHFQRL